MVGKARDIQATQSRARFDSSAPDFSDHHRPSAEHKHLHGPDYDDYSWVMNHDTDSPHNNNDNGGCDDYDDYDDYDNYADDKADDDANDYEKRQR